MITVGICLIYYGVALWGYQLYGWFADGEWNPYPVMAAWKALFGRPEISSRLVIALSSSLSMYLAHDFLDKREGLKY